MTGICGRIFNYTVDYFCPDWYLNQEYLSLRSDTLPLCQQGCYYYYYWWLFLWCFKVAFYHVALFVLSNTWDSHSYVLFLLWLYRQYLSEDMCSTQDCWSLEVVDVMGSWDFSNIALDVSINYSSCTYDDWYDHYFLIPHPLALNLEICVLNQLLCSLLLDVVVTWPHLW